MVQEGCGRIAFFRAARACIWISTSRRELVDFLRTVMPNEMEYPICLCKSLKRAKGTCESAGGVFRVARGHMQRENRRVEKLLMANCAFKRKFPFVLFQMIVHCVLILFSITANVANEFSCCIFSVCVDHFRCCAFLLGAAAISIFPRPPEA